MNGLHADDDREKVKSFPIVYERYEAVLFHTPPILQNLRNLNLAVTDNNGFIQIWDLPAGKKPLDLKLEGSSFQSLALSPDGKTVAATAKDIPKIQLWSTVSGKEIPPLTGFKATIHALAFSPDGKTLVSVAASGPDRTQLWDVASGKVIAPLGFLGSGERIGGVSFSPDGKTLALVNFGRKNTLGLWDLAAQAPTATFSLPTGYQPPALTFSPDSKTLAYTDDNSQLRDTGFKVQLLDVASGKRRATLFNYYNTALAFTPDGKMLAIGKGTGEITLWNRASATTKFTVHGHPDLVRFLVFSPDGKMLVSYGKDKTLKVWHLPPENQ